MINKVMKRFPKRGKEDFVLEIKSMKVSKEELLSHFQNKRERQYLMIDREYHPQICLDYYFYEECYEFFITCRRVEVWDDEQNPWIGRVLFQEGSGKCGTEEAVYDAIQKLGEELYVVDEKEYKEYINTHGSAFWNHGDKTYHAGESVILMKHPLDDKDVSRRTPEFEMQPGRLVYDVHDGRPEFRFDQPIVSHSIYKNGIQILEVTSNVREIENINLELIQ